MNIAAYCRVSTDKADQLNSLETQKRFFREYTERSGDTLVRLYADEGISGTKTKNRTEFLRLMKDAERGVFDMVVVKDISRFARNTVDLLQNIRRLKELGIQTLFLTANMTSMGNSEFVLTIFGALAQEESANTSKRIKFGKAENAKRGKVPNLVYGYDKTAGDYFSLTVNKREAETVRQIFEWYVRSGCGSTRIAEMLNESGVRTKRGCLWSQTSVCRLLSNELYIGRVINGRQEVSDFLTGKRTLRDERDWFITERPDLAIVDPGLFERANSAMRERGQAFRERRERHSSRHLFSTLIKCRECGRSFRRTVRTYRRTFVRWVCSGRNLNGTRFCANSVAVDEDELIDTLNNYFAGILRSRKNVTKYIAGEFDRLCSGRDENARCLRELRGRLTRLKSTRQKYMNMYTDDLISREELNAKLGSMKKESARLESDIRLSQLNSTKGGQLGEILQNTFGTIEKFADVRSMTNAQLRQVLRGIEVDRDGHVDIYLRPAGDMQPGDSVLIRDGRT